MKKMIVSLAITMSSIFALAQPSNDVSKAERMMKAFGGYVTKEGSGTGRIVFVNTTSTVEDDWLKNAVDDIEDLIQCKMIIVKSTEKIGLENAEKVLMKNDAAAAIIIVDDAKLPTMLVAPESDWAFVNVAKLSTTDRGRFNFRVEKELWRTFGILCGAAESQMGGCVLAPVNTIEDLDKLSGKYICPEPMGAIKTHLRHIGVTPYRRTTYRNACLQGWAPQPTNEYQKAIWDKVHSIPNKPMKITFDPAAQKGKVTK